MLARGFGAFVSQCLVFFSSIENGTQTLERCRCFCVNLLYLWLSLFHLDHELQGKIMTTNSSRYNLGRRQDVWRIQHQDLRWSWTGPQDIKHPHRQAAPESSRPSSVRQWKMERPIIFLIIYSSLAYC